MITPISPITGAGTRRAKPDRPPWSRWPVSGSAVDSGGVAVAATSSAALIRPT
jgi:hypothetical protein